MAEEDILDRLQSLNSNQMEILIYRANIPESYLPGENAGTGRIAVGIARSMPTMLPAVQQALDRVLGVATHRPPSTSQPREQQVVKSLGRAGRADSDKDSRPAGRVAVHLSQRRKSLDDGRYKIKGTLGKGASATVYDAFDTVTDERVAVKVLSLNCHDPETARTMFKREVGALDGLKHPNIVPMLRHVNDEDRQELLIVLGKVPGGQSLQELIQEGLPTGKAKRMRWRLEQLLALLDGLQAAHGKSIIHRDLKLGNILFDSEAGQLKLVDFGIARILENYASGNRGATLKAFFTRPYAAPEQALAQEVTFASDLYAFGVVAASLLTWAIPPDNLSRSTLGSFLSPLDDFIADRQALASLRDVLFQLLSDKARSRPNVARVQLALRTVLEGLQDRDPTPIIITNTAWGQATELISGGVEAAIEDLNTGSRVEYQPDKEEPDRYALLVIGRTLQAVLRPDQDLGTNLVLVTVFKQHPNQHNRKRERAMACSHQLEEGRGNGEALIQLAYTTI